MKSFYIGVIIFTISAAVAIAQDTREMLYKTYCAGCHGAELQGNSASPLIKEEWKYGRARYAISSNIKFGIEGTEMAAFNSTLSDDEIEALVVYIIAAQEIPPSEVRPLPSQIETSDYTLKIQKIVEDSIDTPWGITFVNPDLALFTERKGNIRVLKDGKLDPEPISGTPPTQELKTGGYMDIIADPDYEENGWVYLAYSATPGDVTDEDALAMTRVIRGRIKDHRWINQQNLFEVPDSLLVRQGNRWGSRFLFDDEGDLYFSIGDMARADDSQDIGKAPGKVYRINTDGSIPKDNPYAGKPGALEAIFTIGNRNVQGIDQHPVTGNIWVSDHGPMGGDELNILKNGANYGWPVITYGVDYDGSTVSNRTHREGMEQPVLEWTPSIAVCPIKFVDSPLFPKWNNNLMVGALKFEELRRLTIEDQEVTSQEIILKDYGRVRDIEIGPDGGIYVLLNSPDLIIRMIPK